MRIFISYKSSLMAIFLTISLLAISFIISSNFAENIPEQREKEINWQLDSTDTLSIQMEENIRRIIYAETVIGFVTQPKMNRTIPWTYEPLPLISNSVYQFSLYSPPLNDEDSKYRVSDIPNLSENSIISYSVYHDSSSSVQVRQFPLTNNITFVDSLYTWLIADIQSLFNYTLVTNDYQIVIEELQGLDNIPYLAITQIYSDGSAIQIQSFMKDVLIQIKTVSDIEWQGSGFVIQYIDIDNVIVSQGSFSGEIFSNYLTGLSNFFSVIIGE